MKSRRVTVIIKRAMVCVKRVRNDCKQKMLKKDGSSDQAEEEIEEELKRTSEIRSLAI